MGALVTSGKILRDVENIKCYARFAIVVKGNDIFLIDNKYRVDQNFPCMPIIAVIGYADLENAFSQQTVILEIGSGRARPYQQIEFNRRTPEYCFVKGRQRVRCISDAELKQSYNLIVACMADIVLERREKWKHKEARFVHGGISLVQKGIYFTFNKDDASLCRHMLLEDVEYRRERYIKQHVKTILYWLRRFTRIYSSESICLRKYAGAVKVADMLKNHYSDKLYRKKLLETVGQKNYRQLQNVEAIISVFKLVVCNSDIASYLSDFKQVLPFMGVLHCRRIWDQPPKHAKNCIVFEMILEDRFRERNEIPF